ncbi:MAG: TIGR03621 family F420-dependent LLM class oxidoreductase [Actinomycetota bacterium]|nr:TIGR03621 family F420-dependent LLM class oxidoreductase [Actinomycetota bacterium]
MNVRAAASWEDFRRLVHRADELGYDVFAAPDHLGALSPFAVLAAAAATSGRLRLRTYVLNVGFWNPALLAREVATLDLLSGGRAELGVGAGHTRSEHDDAGLRWRPLAERLALLEAVVLEVRRRLGDEGHQPRPVQQPVPLLVGAMSHQGLAVAARHADVVGFSGLRATKGGPPEEFTLASAAETAERVRGVRRQAGGRPYRSDVLLQAVIIGREPEETAARIVATAPHLTLEQIVDTPFVLLGRDADHGAEELRRRRERYGFDSVTTHQPNMEALGEVMAAYRRGAG